MKKYSLFFLPALVSTLYTILVLFSINGFARNSIFDNVISYMNIDNAGIFFISIITLCAIANILLTIVLAKWGRQKSVSFCLYASFVLGCIFILIITSIHVVDAFFYNAYINLFYHGMYYEGEDKVQQVISYIIRVVTLCFFVGVMLSYLFMMVRKNHQLTDGVIESEHPQFNEKH